MQEFSSPFISAQKTGANGSHRRGLATRRSSLVRLVCSNLSTNPPFSVATGREVGGRQAECKRVRQGIRQRVGTYRPIRALRAGESKWQKLFTSHPKESNRHGGQMRANHLSLCAGIGGIDLGLRRVVRGLRTVAMVEREGFCVSHLASKMEAGDLDTCPIYPDLLRFPWDKYRGLVDIVSGGFPCQPFSHAGNRKATEDSRHLWPHIKAGVSVLQPSFCFFENVDGIASAKSPGYHSVLHHVLSDLEEMGFNATAGQFSAEEVGTHTCGSDGSSWPTPDVTMRPHEGM